MPAIVRVTEKKRVPTVRTLGGSFEFINLKRSVCEYFSFCKYIDMESRLNNFFLPSPKTPGKHLRT